MYLTPREWRAVTLALGIVASICIAGLSVGMALGPCPPGIFC